MSFPVISPSGALKNCAMNDDDADDDGRPAGCPAGPAGPARPAGRLASKSWALLVLVLVPTAVATLAPKIKLGIPNIIFNKN